LNTKRKSKDKIVRPKSGRISIIKMLCLCALTTITYLPMQQGLRISPNKHSRTSFNSIIMLLLPLVYNLYNLILTQTLNP
jgi:hypothetical protein